MKHVNIITCLWGHKKFNSLDVNNLYDSVKEHLSIPFTFYCLTDRPFGSTIMNKDIKEVDLTKTLVTKRKLPVYWNKITTLERNWNGTKGISIYLDIDTIVQNDFADILEYGKKDLHIIPGTWISKHRLLHYKKKDGSTSSNSSIMIWDSDKIDKFKYFLNIINDPELLKAAKEEYPGDDMFISNEIPHTHLPDNIACGLMPGFNGKTFPKNGYFLKYKKRLSCVNPDAKFIVLSGATPFKGLFKLNKYIHKDGKIIKTPDNVPEVFKNSFGSWTGSNNHSGSKD